ncbi:bud site selection protein [Babesia ovis]|uniref:Bud site selection protein n=1 Tax=Babesia ovis TaxID=5869 RepID=A0A9W5TB74_BABOV|nr:bud site selection protein [Babesia ovis]
MGGRRKARHKGIGKKRHLKRGIRDLKHRGKDIDQVYEAVMANDMEVDGDVDGSDDGKEGPYCKYCDRHFIDKSAMQSHKREKGHKKRVKEVHAYQPMD